MTTPTPGQPEAARETRRALALALVIVAAVFSGVVIGVMAVSFAGETGLGYPQSNLVATLKDKLDKDPGNETLKADLRDTDTQMRQAFYVRRHRIELGAVLLTVGLVVLVVCARWYVSLRPTIRPALQRNLAAPPRRSLTILSLIILAVAMAVSAFFLKGALVPVVKATVKRPSPVTITFKENWPDFRGPNGSSFVAAGSWPTSWDATVGRNILWSTPLPLAGKGSPVVWGGRIFLTAADSKIQRVICVDRETGKVLWDKSVSSPENDGRLKLGDKGALTLAEDAGFAAPTPVTDGRRVYALFASADVAAIDFDGRVVWVRNFGKPDTSYGLTSSLAMAKDRLIFQYDQGREADENLSAIYGLDPATGATVWRTPRPVKGSWCSPIVADTPAGQLLIASGNPWVIAYDPATGAELWRCDALSGDVAASPAYVDGKVFTANDGADATAIRIGGSGDVTKTHVLWTASQAPPEAASPVSDGNYYIQVTSGNGTLTCFNAADGTLLWKQNFDCGFWASPEIANGVLYLTGDDGKTRLIRLGDKYDLIGEATVGEQVDATPAFVDGEVIIRGQTRLFCIGPTP